MAKNELVTLADLLQALEEIEQTLDEMLEQVDDLRDMYLEYLTFEKRRR